jgi:hypothetical protein
MDDEHLFLPEDDDPKLHFPMEGTKTESKIARANIWTRERTGKDTYHHRLPLAIIKKARFGPIQYFLVRRCNHLPTKAVCSCQRSFSML